MRLDDIDPSGDIQDQGAGGGGFSVGGGGGMGSLIFGLLPLLLGRKMGCGTIAILGIAAFFLLGPGLSLFSGSTSAPGEQTPGAGNAACDTAAEAYACRVFTSAETTWAQLFSAGGQRYQPAKLRFYQGGGQSGCGAAQSAMGPFYCPADGGVYLDTSFFQQIDQMTGGRDNDFAYAYVVAHEIGHHIQNITGVADKVRTMQNRVSQEDGNALQIRMELQADCYAGIWANKNAVRMDAGDVEEGMRAAHAIGDDKLMRDAGRAPVESMFTHGTSEQRMAALKQGLRSGNPNSCNYFSGIF
ncbi:MAG: neutral zinc metallopeptidase [Sphingomonadales bacterium]|jgi:predicted metalloprotease|nr:neutral zinc metallopeptidase [Sphingomonadales bacterium]MBK9268582.1 neutral zinc metallopeptidase [Sphingomonadales bacterium]MBP6434126.1 neutral zinc metallopeptidase [Sphingorhabdus sp.]